MRQHLGVVVACVVACACWVRGESPVSEAKPAWLRVQWNVAVSESISPGVFGSNIFRTPGDEQHRSEAFGRYMAETGFRFVRIHQGGLYRWLSDEENRTVAADRVLEGFGSFTWDADGKTVYCLNIPNVPVWVGAILAEGKTDEAVSEYGRFCGELARLIKDRCRVKITYWEPLNEGLREEFDRGRIETKWRLWVAAAKAIKAVDEAFKLVGPTPCECHMGIFKSFIAYVDGVDPALLDCVTWHTYPIGLRRVPTSAVMQRTPEFGRDARAVRELVDRLRPGRKTELLLGEFNINYNWEDADPRMKDHVGAVWFGSVFNHLIRGGIDHATSWHIDEGAYGMVSLEGQVRPAGELYRYANNVLGGRACEVAGTDEGLEAIATESGKHWAVLVVNKSEAPRAVTLDTDVRLDKNERAKSVGRVGGVMIDAAGTRALAFEAEGLEIDPVVVPVEMDGLSVAMVWIEKDVKP